jgi:hypothetical protein
MTPAQFRAASHGGTQTGSPGYDIMSSEYSIGRYKFKIVFDYKPPSSNPGDSDPSHLGLDAVLPNLDASSGTCTDLAAYLITMYGKPGRTFEVLKGLLWSRNELGDVEYSTSAQPGHCNVMYMPLGGRDH